MVDFINEVEEELRKDKYNQLLRKFGPYIVGLVFLIVGITGYMEYNKSKVSNLAKSASASYQSASRLAESGNLIGAVDKFTALARVAPDGYAGLSLSRAAGLKVQLGDLAGAVSLLDQAADMFHKPVHKDLAGLKASYILLELGRFDEVQVRTGLLTGSDAPYQDLAKELSAHAALGAGHTELARKGFAYLSNAPGVSQGVKRRAIQALALINANKSVEIPDIGDAPDILPKPTPDAPAKPNQDEQE